MKVSILNLMLCTLNLATHISFAQVHDNACFFNSDLVENSHWTKQTKSDASILYCAVYQKLKTITHHKNPIVKLKLDISNLNTNSPEHGYLNEAFQSIKNELQTKTTNYSNKVNQDLKSITQNMSKKNEYADVTHIARLKWFPKQRHSDYKKQSEFILFFKRIHDKKSNESRHVMDLSFYHNQAHISVKAKELLEPSHSKLINYIYQNFQITTELTISTDEYLAKNMQRSSGDDIDNRNDEDSLVLVKPSVNSIAFNVRVKTPSFLGNKSNQLHVAILNKKTHEIIPIHGQNSIIIDTKLDYFDIVLNRTPQFHQSINLIFCISTKEMDFLEYANASPKVIDHLLSQEDNLHLKQLIIDSSQSYNRNSIINFDYSKLLQSIKLSPLDYFVQSAKVRIPKKGTTATGPMKNHLKQVYLNGLGIILFEHKIHIKEEL